MKARRNGTPMLAPSGYVAQVDADQCTACSTCLAFCQFGALGLVNGSSFVEDKACMGCGVCVSKCPREAIALRREPSKGIPLEMRVLVET
jgi:heterodisulfide reductase subunit A-like polyferredoxin